jgi:hypothetical protein
MNIYFKSLALCALLFSSTTQAVTTTFFNSAQPSTLVKSGSDFDTLSSDGYLITYTLDKRFTGGVDKSKPIGRNQVVSWPQGLHAQALTVAPQGKAEVTIRRVDGHVFDLIAFSAKLIGSTATTGADFEVVPMLNGEDLYNDPITFSAAGNTGNIFTYGQASNSEPLSAVEQANLQLTGADSYTIGLFTDFALIGITLKDASTPSTPAANTTFKNH